MVPAFSPLSLHISEIICWSRKLPIWENYIKNQVHATPPTIITPSALIIDKALSVVSVSIANNVS